MRNDGLLYAAWSCAKDSWVISKAFLPAFQGLGAPDLRAEEPNGCSGVL